MATFGKTTIGTEETSTSSNYIFGCKFTLNENGQVTKISVYCKALVAHNCQCNIYADSAGNPTGSPLGVSQEAEVGTSYAWVHFNYAVSLSLTAGVYHLFIGHQGSVGSWYVKYDAGSTDQLSMLSWTYGVWPDPFAGGTKADYEMSIYATYTPAVAVSRVCREDIFR